MTQQGRGVKVTDALNLTVDQLFEQIGQESEEPGTAYFQRPDFGALGRGWWHEIEGQVRDLVCGTSDEWKTERDTIKSAMDNGAATAGVAIAGALVGLPVIPAAAVAFVAALVIKLVYKGAWQLTCDNWKLPQPDPGE